MTAALETCAHGALPPCSACSVGPGAIRIGAAGEWLSADTAFDIESAFTFEPETDTEAQLTIIATIAGIEFTASAELTAEDVERLRDQCSVILGRLKEPE